MEIVTLFTTNRDCYTKIFFKKVKHIFECRYGLCISIPELLENVNYPHDRLHTSSENNRLNIFVIACAIIRAGKSIWVGAHFKNPRVYLLKPFKIWYIFRLLCYCDSSYLIYIYIYIVLTLHLKNECSLLFIIGKKPQIIWLIIPSAFFCVFMSFYLSSEITFVLIMSFSSSSYYPFFLGAAFVSL